MASRNRRGSHDTTYEVGKFSKTRTASIDYGLANDSIDNSRQLLNDASNTSHVQATLIAQGPPVAFFGYWVIDDVLYIHGGVKTRADHSPSNLMFKFENNHWTEIAAEGSPVLSYHRCLVVNGGQYVLAIGGWDGSKRKSDVFVYDVENRVWHMTHVTGFPADGGLNNHAIIQFKTGDTGILVVGRDGSLRMQRKHGDAYCLRGDPIRRIFRYEQYPIFVHSRSGHSLVGYGSSMYIIGGRADHLIQQYTGLSVENPIVSNGSNGVLKQMMKSNIVVPMKKLPSARKDHTSLPCGSDLVVVYGGETFDGKLREPSNEVFLVTLGSNQQWYNLGLIQYGRQGHAMVSLADRIIVHGGLGKNGVCGETFSIDLVQ